MSQFEQHLGELALASRSLKIQFGKLNTQCAFPQLKTDRWGRKFKHPCGRCQNCLHRVENARIGRVLAEAATGNSMVATLTIDDEHLEEKHYRPEWWQAECDNLQRRHRRLNVKNGIKSKNLVRFVAERGGLTDRPHAHCVLMNTAEMVVNKMKWQKRPWWPYGKIELDAVKPSSIKYVLGYLSDPEKKAKRIWWRTSKKIGQDYFKEYVQHMAEGRAKHGCRYDLYPDEFGVMPPILQINHLWYPMDPTWKEQWPFKAQLGPEEKYDEYLEDRQAEIDEHGSVLHAQWRREDDHERVRNQREQFKIMSELREQSDPLCLFRNY